VRHRTISEADIENRMARRNVTIDSERYRNVSTSTPARSAWQTNICRPMTKRMIL